MDEPAVPADRRGRRRAETIEQILAIAVEVMATEGVAGLSLSDVARRLGVRPPSLYKYFPAKNAVYDAVFAEGARRVRDEFRAGLVGREPGLAALAGGLERFARFGLGHPVYAQLLYWRTVPGFTPSPRAYRPAVDLVTDIAAVLRAAVDRGQLHPDAVTDDGQAILSVLVGGALTQQIANEPDAGYDDGRFTRLLPRLLDMYVASYPPT